MRALVFVLILAAALAARDKKASQLQSKGITLAKKAKAGWKRFILERDKVTNKELKALIKNLELAADLLHQSLEIEDYEGINGQIISISRKLVKLRFAEHIREQRRKIRERAAKAKAKAKSKPKTTPKTKPEDDDTPDPKPEEEEKTEPEPEPEITFVRGLPDLVEDKKAKRRGLQTLRNFLMHYYFANRRFSTLMTRCTRCNGTASIVIGRVGKTRKLIFAKCPSCNPSGGHLNVNAARKAFWLVMSPLHRANAANREAFEANLESWRQDPRRIGEFLKRLSIQKIEYHGLWAIVDYNEKGTIVSDGQRQRGFRRKVQRMFVRLGKRWFIYDESTDAAFFSDEDESESD